MSLCSFLVVSIYQKIKYIALTLQPASFDNRFWAPRTKHWAVEHVLNQVNFPQSETLICLGCMDCVPLSH